MDTGTVFRNLLMMAVADGRLAESELQWLSHQAAAWGITDDQFEEALEAASSGQAELVLPPEHADRIALLKDMLRVMAADGHLAEREKKLFAIASASVGIPVRELNGLIDAVLRANDQGE